MNPIRRWLDRQENKFAVICWTILVVYALLNWSKSCG